jgi:hypothetical protein
LRHFAKPSSKGCYLRIAVIRFVVFARLNPPNQSPVAAEGL